MKPMRWISTLPLQLRTLFLKKHLEQELDEELRFHLDRKMEQMVESGMPSSGVAEAASKQLKLDRQKEQCREVRAWHWMDVLRADVIFGWRQLAKHKVT